MPVVTGGSRSTPTTGTALRSRRASNGPSSSIASAPTRMSTSTQADLDELDWEGDRDRRAAIGEHTVGRDVMLDVRDERSIATRFVSRPRPQQGRNSRPSRTSGASNSGSSFAYVHVSNSALARIRQPASTATAMSSKAVQHSRCVEQNEKSFGGYIPHVTVTVQ